MTALWMSCGVQASSRGRDTKGGIISRREIIPPFVSLPLLEACTPQDIHNAVIRLFHTFVQVGVLNSKSGEACKDGHELNIVFVECAKFTGVDTQDADSFAMHLQGNTQDGYDAFIFRCIFVLEAFI